jgi:threonine aldolase
MELNFRSDNEAPAHPALMEAVVEANRGTATAYAEDRWSRQLERRFSDLFETPTVVLPVITGTVANSMALAAVTPPWGSVYCHQNAHCLNDESGAPEFYGHGLRLVPLSGKDGKMTARALHEKVLADEGHGVHSYRPAAFSITQSTESGTVYEIEEIRQLTATARQLGMYGHMDGARFANALAHLKCSPAAISSQAGMDMLSFGATKNGALGAEALLIFNPDIATETAERLRKRGGHLLSKMRYVSAQLLAYLENGLWLRLAERANQAAAVFATAVEAHPDAGLEFPVQANEVFVRWTPEGLGALEHAGIRFLYWPGRTDLARFVFSHAVTDEETRTLCEALASC